MNKINYITYRQTVKKRKYEINQHDFALWLREYKSNSSLTISQIATQLNIPKTEVEHWFRTDKCGSIPSAKYWYDLKQILHILDQTYDKQVMEFIELDGVYDMAERYYFINGLSPTLTGNIGEYKIVIGSY